MVKRSNCGLIYSKINRLISRQKSTASRVTEIADAKEDALAIAYGNLPQNVFENVKNRFPKSGPFVLTHSDLNLGNIMIRDGQLVGILDWEYAAYLPLWYEYISASFAFTEMGVEWKKVIRERLSVHGDAYDEARALWKDLISLKQYPNLDEKGKEALGRLSSA